MLFQENKTLKENILSVKKEKYTKKEKITNKRQYETETGSEEEVVEEESEENKEEISDKPKTILVKKHSKGWRKRNKIKSTKENWVL